MDVWQRKRCGGLRNLECGEGIAASYCGKLLADLGAEVVKVEKPEGAVFFIIVAILVFSRFLAMSRIPDNFAQWLVGLSVDRYVILAGIILMYIFLGCLIDALGMLLLTLPVVFQAIVALGFDPIWFGVVCVMVTEIGVITPPFGINVSTLRAVAPKISLEEAFRGIWPFFGAQVVTTVILTAFPQIALFLPSLMARG